MATPSKSAPVSVVQLSALLLLLSSCWGAVLEYYDDVTPVPEYDDNTTIYYSFYSNSSSDDLDRFLNVSTNYDQEAEDVTMTATIMSTVGPHVRVEADSSAPSPWSLAPGPIIWLLLSVALIHLRHTC